MRIAPKSPFRLSSVETFSNPFEFFCSPKALKIDLSRKVLEWLEAEAPWKLIETDFYEQYEFSLWDVDVPFQLRALLEPDFLDGLRRKLGDFFNAQFSDEIDVAAHKLIPGQRIRIHNDFISGEKTYRLLIQLNRGSKDEDGGLLLLFNSSDPAEINKAFRPIHNSAIGFVVSPKSNHAVSTIHRGERFTLVYSFHKMNANE